MLMLYIDVAYDPTRRSSTNFKSDVIHLTVLRAAV